MSEELLQTEPISVGRYRYYKLGATTLRQLRAEKIVREPVPGHLLTKKPDGLMVLHGGGTRAAIEYKPPDKLRTERQIQATIERDIEAAAALCKLLILTTGTKSVWINALNGERVLTADGTELRFVVNAKTIGTDAFPNGEFERLLDAADVSLSATQNSLAAPSVLDPSALAGSIWQKIWVQTGKSPEKCLYNVVELFVFKFLSDLSVLKPHNNFWSVERLAAQGEAQDALKHYANTCRKDVQELFPPGSDGTTIINGTIFVNENGEPNPAQSSLFAEIVKQLAVYDQDVGSFRYIKREFKTRLYESFLRQSAGVKALGQYFTPRNVVRAMVRMARPVNHGARICDPFCGVGGFLLELLMEDGRLFREFYPREGRISPRVTLIGYDKGTDEQEDERTIILAKANMLIYFSDLLAEHHSRSDLRAFAESGLNAVFRLLRTNLGTFDETQDDPYDLILTNPPYVTKGSSTLQATIAEQRRTKSFFSFGLKGTEGLALNWIIKHLKPGGEAFVIVPDGLLRRQREASEIQEHCLVRAIVSLPSKTFYATPKQTYILALEKKEELQQEQSDPVFAYVVQETGETRDAKRLDTPDNHLDEMADAYCQFRGAEQKFVSGASRCKVVPFADVKARSDWRVDRWWSYEERVALGLDDERPIVRGREFADEMAEFGVGICELARRCGRGEAQQRVYGEICLNDPAVFDFVVSNTGWTDETLSRLVVEDGDAAPVYRAAAAAYGRVPATHEKLIHASEDSPLVSFASNGNGSAGANFVLHQEPFFVTGDRTVIRVTNARVDPDYVIYALRNMKLLHGFDHTHKAVPKNLGAVVVRVPTMSDGGWDLEAQREIAAQYRSILEVQRTLRRQAEAVANYDIRI